MSYELISDEEYASLPNDDERCFVEFESICRRNMTRMIDDDSTQSFDRAVREQYMAAVTAVALECRIPDIDYRVLDDANFYDAFARFSLTVQGQVARIRIRSRGSQQPNSVLLTASTRSKIEHYIPRIRDIVDRSDLDAGRKKRVLTRLDQLASELGNSRMSFARTMGILAGILATTSSSVTIAADGQSAVAHIVQLIGHDKESEETAALRLTPPPKALPAPLTQTPPPPEPEKQSGVELDEEIPF